MLGALIIEIDAPAGSTPNVVVSSATVQRIVRQTRTIDSLPPGVYQVRADDILTDSTTWFAETQSVQVLASQSAARAEVKFRPVGASIVINASGLPWYARGTVRVSGPNGLQRTALTRDTVRLLPPGSYTVVVDPVETTDGRFEALPSSHTVTINGRQTASVDFSFSQPKAALTVSVAGLPNGALAGIAVTGPSGFADRVDATRTFTGLEAGLYRASAARVSSGGFSYDPDAATRDVTMSGAQSRAMAFAYRLATGAMAVSLGGLPAGASGHVSIAGPAGYSRVVTSSQTLIDLAPGTYRLTASPVTVSGVAYTPAPAIVDVVVTASLVASPAEIQYAGSTGAIALVVEGLPLSLKASIKVTRPNGSSFWLTGSETVDNLPVGDYTLEAQSITGTQDSYDPEVTTRALKVQKDETTNTRVRYNARTGGLSVSIVGLPSGVPAAVRVTGPNKTDIAVTSTTTLGNLAVGTYTITSSAVISGGTQYTGTPASASVEVVRGTIASHTVSYGGQSTAFTVDFSGLPGGTAASATVTGPNGFSRAVSGPVVLENLTAGTYRISSATVTTSTALYTAAPAVVDVSLQAGDRKSQTIAYALSTGSMAISVAGLPSGTAASVTVAGPNGFAQSVSSTQTLLKLAPGTYTVTAANVLAGGVTYTASPALRTLQVTASLVAAAAPVSYGNALGGLRVAITGLPTQASGAVTTHGPNSATASLSQTAVMGDLAVGSWDVRGHDVTIAGERYAPSPATRTVSVVASDTIDAPVAFSRVTGRLTLSVTGLPSGATSSITVSGPSGFSRAVTASQTLVGLEAGTYTIAASPVTVGSTQYTPSASTQSVAVTVGGSESRSVAYAGQTTSLALTVSGVPSGSEANLTVSGPNGFSEVIGSTTTLAGLSAGTYSLAAARIVAGNYGYAASPAAQSVSLTTGDAKSASVAYAVSTGALSVSLSGLAAGVSAAVTVTGPSGFSRALSASQTLGDLAPGTYTISAGTVSSGGSTYTPTPTSQTRTVTAGATASGGVSYTASGGGGSPGANLSVEGAYVTQAIQSFAGDVPLVAGRDALLRVFVKAGASNSLTPSVRVRLFSGTTNFRTFTIAAPSSSVPTAIAEESLHSSWNAPLSASDLRVGLRIQVDVDPTNTVSESNENDNVFPSSGTKALDVRTVAPFNVVFVPVHQSVNGLTGDVTPSNLESRYMSMTRAIFPLAEINASVRATYTTNRPALEPNNGNYAWSYILSELNSLRIADGSQAHYYGIVKTTYGSGIAGYAFMPGHVGIGWDHAGTSLRVTAHELGHNFNRAHVAACGSGNADTRYPHAGGIIAHLGWNSATNSLVPTTVTDVMGYCDTQWISDYTWSEVMSYRGPAPMMAGFATGPQPTLMVWGHIQNGAVALEPALRLVTTPVVPTRAGSYRLELRDIDGRVLTGFSFDPEAIDHDNAAGSFAFAVPLSALTDSRLHSVAVVGGVRGTVEQTARAAANSVVGGVSNVTLITADGGSVTVSDPEPRLSRSGNSVRMSWDDQSWPLVLVKDLQTGQTLSYLRQSGDGFLSQSGSVRVVFSNGIRSVTKELSLP